ncbi:MAG: DUF4139 domain-containing protein [Candidatus Cloacimonadaceae bacterium]|nr:DUF4139 domain-containing protein [Candidatus Cloacimonadota bacterium]MDX9949126.1 DUF4139 domain-containing protein [Candidatus Syntrophosphaera sp.]
MKKTLILAIALAILALPIVAEDWITIYNDDLSLVRGNFELELEAGLQDYNFDDISSRIDAPTVIVRSLDGGVRVAEQNYEYDLAGKRQIIAKYLDREVELFTKDGERVIGTLKFFDTTSYGVIEKGSQRLIVIADSQVQLLKLAELPTNFYTKPTLHWSLIANKAGKHPLQLSYLTGGLSWDVSYNAIWDEETLALNSWVTIKNQSGKSFEDVTLKLIAGDINRIREEYDFYAKNIRYMDVAMGAESPAPSFEEKAFHDFHMYTLDQKVSFANNQTKQLELYPTQNIKAEQVYEYPIWGDGVKSIIKFKNTEANGIGKPLPKGKIRVYMQDSDDNLEFIGEDNIKHTSKNEEVNITTGKAFDLVASTLVKDIKDLGKKVSERDIQVTLRNNSSESKAINVIYTLGSNTRITEVKDGHEYSMDTNRKVRFPIQVEPDAQVILTFTERTEY